MAERYCVASNWAWRRRWEVSYLSEICKSSGSCAKRNLSVDKCYFIFIHLPHTEVWRSICWNILYRCFSWTLYGLLPWLYASTSPPPIACELLLTIWCERKLRVYDTIVGLFLQKQLLRGHTVTYKVMEPFIHCRVSFEINNGQMVFKRFRCKIIRCQSDAKMNGSQWDASVWWWLLSLRISP